ncbi:hypothetical protein HBI80_254980 [Parastagonospora nodorum]|nr:hypothetical protein HBI80_254980 [Parastagonospora nodorum]KAH5702142.1 hypothetical protein HBI20_255410 [Parastagonospora nodorum]
MSLRQSKNFIEPGKQPRSSRLRATAPAFAPNQHSDRPSERSPAQLLIVCSSWWAPPQLQTPLPTQPDEIH